MALTLTFPAVSFAEPGDDPAADPAPAEESVNITMEYRYAEGETPNIPQTLTQGGIGYRLISQADPVAESTLPRTRTYTYKIDGSISKQDLAEIEKIPNIVLTPVYVEVEKEVDKTEKIQNLDNNDVDDLPNSKEFQVHSADAKNNVKKEDLSRAGVTFEVSKWEGAPYDSLPEKYTATIVYRGIETYSEIGYYTAQMNYQTDEVVGNIPQYVVIAQYEPLDSGAAEADEEEAEEIAAISEEEDPVPDVSDPDTNIDERTAKEAEQFDAQTGNPLTDLLANNVPLGNLTRTDAWSILSLMIVLIALIWSAALVAGAVIGRNKDVEKYADVSEEKKRLSKLTRTVAIILGVIAALVWYLLDDLSLKMVMINRYTIIIFAIFLVQVAFFILSGRAKSGAGKSSKDDLQAAG
jgi:hypothetical protein